MTEQDKAYYIKELVNSLDHQDNGRYNSARDMMRFLSPEEKREIDKEVTKQRRRT